MTNISLKHAMRMLVVEDHAGLAASLTTQVTKFVISGGFATLIHWTAMSLLIREGSQPVLATTMGALAGSVFNYVFQFYWTFTGIGAHGKAMPTYACTVILDCCRSAADIFRGSARQALGLVLFPMQVVTLTRVSRFYMRGGRRRARDGDARC